MAHVYIEDIGKHEGEEVSIKGWLHNRRSSGKIHFLIVRDGTGFIQGVMSKAAVGDTAPPQRWRERRREPRPLPALTKQSTA